MILHELLGKPPYVPPKLKPQRAPEHTQKKPDEPAGTGAALDRVRKQLRRDAMKPQETEAQKHKKPVSAEEKNIRDRMKQIEELQREHESRKRK
jgi:DEAD/DEAH box helicase domain-containing protein